MGELVRIQETQGNTSQVTRSQKGYRKLIVWQKANELAYLVYSETKRFPHEEIYGVTSQLRRAPRSR